MIAIYDLPTIIYLYTAHRYRSKAEVGFQLLWKSTSTHISIVI